MDICLDSEQLRVLTYAIKTFPAHGSLSSFDKDSGAVTYTSNRGYTDLIVSPFLPVMEYQQEKAQDLAVVVFIIISIGAIFTISSVFVNISLSNLPHIILRRYHHIILVLCQVRIVLQSPIKPHLVIFILLLLLRPQPPVQGELV